MIAGVRNALAAGPAGKQQFIVLPPGRKNFPPGGPWRKRGRSLPVEGHAVGALIHGGIALVGAHQNPIQGAVILTVAVVGALVHGALNGLVGMTIHNGNLLSLRRVRRVRKFMRIDFSNIM